MNPSEVLFRSKPLFFNNSGDVVLAKNNSLYLRSGNGQLKLLIRIPGSLLKRFLVRFSLIARLARLGFGTGVFYQGVYFFTYDAKIYSFDPKEGRLRLEFTFDSGRGPLNFTVVEGISGFKDGIYFGEYFGNRARRPIKIFKRTKESEWHVTYCFSDGMVNHVHSIVSDPHRDCLWILTGDFDHSACIWMARDGFNDVAQVVAGQQIYRACVAFPTLKGLLYATDTQISRNSLRLLSNDGGDWVSRHLADINGPCIYGCELRDYFIFSTATEPSDKTSSSFHSLLDRNPGPGIIENRSDVIAVKKSNFGIRTLFSRDKDYLPYRLFQFGSILFPQGEAQDNTLFSFSIGNWGNDLSTEVHNLNAE